MHLPLVRGAWLAMLLCLAVLAPLVAHAGSLTAVDGRKLPALPAVASVHALLDRLEKKLGKFAPPPPEPG